MAGISIDEADWSSRARLKCPTAGRHTDWYATEDGFFCRSCGEEYRTFIDSKHGRYVRRREVSLRRRRRKRTA